MLPLASGQEKIAFVIIFTLNLWKTQSTRIVLIAVGALLPLLKLMPKNHLPFGMNSMPH